MAGSPFEDLGAPSDFGSAAPPRSASRPPVDNTADQDTPAGQVSPEHVHYHDDEQRCDMCRYFGRGNQCSYLGIPVPPEGGCIAFKNGVGDEDPDADADTDTAPFGDTDDDNYDV